MTFRSRPLFLALAAASLGACSDFTAPAGTNATPAIAFSTAAAPGGEAGSALAAMVERTNADLEARGARVRVSEVWLFTLGLGVDPYRQLRTGLRWDPQDGTVDYMISSSPSRMAEDGLSVEATTAAMAAGYDSWGAIENAGLRPVQVADVGGNIDMFDGFFHPVTGACLSLFDLTSPRIEVQGNSLILHPASDIVVGGFLDERYFDRCLENDADETSSIIAVTLLIDNLDPVDDNGDGYADATYVEQFYNRGFNFVTTGARYLDFLFFPEEEPMVDLESVAVHENGHALGLGHFGAIASHGLTLKPNLKVFSPHAVMNPGYLGGEVRSLLPTDEAAFRTMYAQMP